MIDQHKASGCEQRWSIVKVFIVMIICWLQTPGQYIIFLYVVAKVHYNSLQTGKQEDKFKSKSLTSTLNLENWT